MQQKKSRLMPVLVALSAFGTACSKNSDNGGDEGKGPPMVFGQTVRGIVTYKGERVVYGYVLFYHMEKGTDQKTGVALPMAFAEIKNGAYETSNAPTGMMMVCVATDPDSDPMLLLHPAKPGGPQDKGGPDAVGPPESPDAPHKVDGPKDAPTPPKPEKGFNPFTQKLSPVQKDVLREIHKKYGVLGRSPLITVIREGVQTYDIVLEK